MRAWRAPLRVARRLGARQAAPPHTRRFHAARVLAGNLPSALEHHINRNKAFVEQVKNEDPYFFETLAKGQSPETLWLGCADSRVPETTVLGAKPGDIFVHRNIANMLHADDFNAGSVVEYAVAHLKVKRIIICGHTKCGGAIASLGDADLGKTLNTWLEPLREVRRKHQEELERLGSDDERAVRLAELNVLNSLDILRAKETVKRAVEERDLEIHGALFHLATGQLEFLDEQEKRA